MEITLKKEDFQIVWENTGSYSELELLENQAQKKYPLKPNKPHLPSKHTVEDVKAYGEQLAFYEILLAEYQTEKGIVVDYNNELAKLLGEFVQEVSGYNALSDTQQRIVFDFYYNNFSKNSFAEKWECITEIVKFVIDITENTK